MQQLALPIQAPIQPTLDNFVCGRNVEALAALRALASHSGEQTFLYLWGPKGSGKSHLLQGLNTALQQESSLAPFFVDAAHAAPNSIGQATQLLVDNVHLANPILGESLFHAWNRIREQGGLLICTGDLPPSQLSLAGELSSRLAWGQVYRLYQLDDEEKWAALKLKATSSAIPITDEALSYLMMHAERDMPSLIHTLAQLDQWSLSSQRTITVPTVRAYLATIQHSN